MQKITIGVNISKIGKNAFYGCKKLKQVVIKTKKLSSGKVGAKAFKGIAGKAMIKGAESKKKSYEEWLRKKELQKE